MKLGLLLEPSPGTATLPGLIRQARACEDNGLEFGWLASAGEPAGGHRALHRVAALSGATGGLRLLASVPVGGHPLRIAEEAAVADNCCGGRLVLVLVDRGSEPGLLGETADVVLTALSGRPFSHVGEGWQIPARRPENEGVPSRLTLTPPPVQPELPVWLAGDAAPAAARERCLSHVAASADDDAAATRAWADTESRLGRAARRLRRPAVRRIDASLDGSFDAGDLVAELCAARDGWGMDTAVIRLPAQLGDPAREAAIRGLASRVKPRLVLAALPTGLEQHWREVLRPTPRGAR
jgi:alkanesulfonate monooxygenase SsuD/methylene tetrahydromethanopterin reductase-like flavin-dependent oxidoreductase (luciferase family)